MRRAQEFLKKGDFTFAGSLFRSLIDETAAPERMAQSLVGLGRICYAQGDVARAIRYAQEALRHDSLSRAARELLADSTSPDQSPSAHDAWRGEADLAQQ